MNPVTAVPKKLQVEQLRTIAEVSRAITSELDMDKLLQLVADLLSERFGYPFIHIFIVRSGRRWIEFKAGTGLFATQLEPKELSFSLDNEGIIPWVARTGQSALINNVYEDTHFEPIIIPGIEIRSELTVPLIFGDSVLGVFDVESEQLNAFTSHDQWLLETVADTVAIAIRNAMLYQSEVWRRRAADSLRQIAGVVRTKETSDNTLAAILSELAGILPFSFATIWLKVDDGYQFKIGIQLEEDPPVKPVTQPWFDQIVASSGSQIRKPTDPASPLAEELPPDHSAVGGVLAVDENVLGVMVLVHKRPKRYGQEARRLVEIFAGQAAIVIENTELYYQARKQAWISTALLQVAEATRNLQSLDDVLTAVTRISPVLAGVTATAIWLRQPETDSYSLSAYYGLSQQQERTLTNNVISANTLLLLQLVVLKRYILLRPGESEQQLPPAFVPQFSDSLLLFLPLLSQGSLNGLMMMVLDQSDSYSDEQLQMLSGIAHQAASAIQTAQLIEGQREEAYVSTALLQVAQTIVIPSDLSEVLGTVVRITPMLTGVNYCLVFLYDDADSCTLSAAYGLKNIDLPLEISLADSSLLQTAMVDNAQISFSEADLLPECLQAAFTVANFQGLIVPLSVQNRIVGALMVGNTDAKPLLRGKRRDIITGIAYQIALAIDNARLYREQARQAQLERDLYLAQQIQASFIPQELPNLPGWELGSFWKMAREVGGDFFDVIPMPNERLFIIIADVADKGLPASLFMVRTSSLVRATVLEFDQPAAILSRVNYLLAHDAQQTMFVSAFCAIINLKTGQISYASAGHNPPVFIRANKTIELLQTKGVVLGVMEEAEFEQANLTLQLGDGILFYTDGVTEAYNEAEELFGSERLFEAIEKNQALSAQEMVNQIYQSVTEFFQPLPQFDDFTILLIRRELN